MLLMEVAIIHIMILDTEMEVTRAITTTPTRGKLVFVRNSIIVQRLSRLRVHSFKAILEVRMNLREWCSFEI